MTTQNTVAIKDGIITVTFPNGQTTQKPVRETLQVVFEWTKKVIRNEVFWRRCVEIFDKDDRMTAMIVRKTRLFNPIAARREEDADEHHPAQDGEEYMCDIWWSWSENSRLWIGSAEPTDEYKLILPKEVWAGNTDLAALYPRVSFTLDKKDGQDRLISRDEEGKIIFPNRKDESRLKALLLPETNGVRQTPPVQVFLKEDRTVCRARYIPDLVKDEVTGEEISSTTALARVAHEEGELRDLDLLRVPLTVCMYKPGVQNSDDSKDLVSKTESRLIYDLMHTVGRDQLRGGQRFILETSIRSSQERLKEVFQAVAMQIAPDLHAAKEAEAARVASGASRISAAAADEIARYEAMFIGRPLATKVTRHNVYQALCLAYAQAVELHKRIDSGAISADKVAELEGVIEKYRTLVAAKKKAAAATPAPAPRLPNPVVSPTAAEQLSKDAAAPTAKPDKVRKPKGNRPEAAAPADATSASAAPATDPTPAPTFSGADGPLTDAERKAMGNAQLAKHLEREAKRVGAQQKPKAKPPALKPDGNGKTTAVVTTNGGKPDLTQRLAIPTTGK